ncbi:Methyltransferase type 12 [Psychromonas ingrahamii 37]|uniref:Methyltransferase type 12 n=1 Tax=Psychromonas ingrahamii (strain DSM 17664 / CCUG 51855 / 37) TaxID=357804 RepID=A1SXN0_PSYIN|nr:class I SAM-dependent methyltransferase [Psychromonas ingrahamii]ABM04245.1 Methyltransferase type 12 [Psychromonas ingrahamii 37]
MLNINQQYYDENAQDFYDATIALNMQSLYRQFLPLIPAGGSILDAGSGAGRDSKAFLDLGFDVEAFDASEKLALLASELTGKKVAVELFQTFESKKQFDGIWACASLLHVSLLELPAVFLSLSNMLKSEGLFYCSFKYGEGEVARNGRVFTNLNECGFASLIKGLPLRIKDQWITADLREGRENEKWLNVILQKD